MCRIRGLPGSTRGDDNDKFRSVQRTRGSGFLHGWGASNPLDFPGACRSPNGLVSIPTWRCHAFWKIKLRILDFRSRGSPHV